MGAPDPAVAIPSIMKSHDKAWLQGFRVRMMALGAPDIISAIDKRLDQLQALALHHAIGRPPADLTLAERVHEAIRVYEEFLAHKHAGKRLSASRTRAMIKRWGEKEAVRRTVTNMTMSTGLELLVKHDRLDCSYEQIILDFPSEFDLTTVANARENLARLPKES